MLAMTTVGHGPIKVLATHTWLADQSTYAPMKAFIDQDAFTYVFPDFRGYGRSRGLAGEMTVREMGRDLVATADALGWGRFHIVGNSMGGQAAQWVAGQHPDRVAGVVLLCAVPARGFPLDVDTAAFFNSAIDTVDVRGQLASVVTGGRLGAGFAKHMARTSAETATRDAIARYLTAWTSENVESDLKSRDVPVSIFVGEHDPVLTADVCKGAIASQFKTTTLATIPGTGHYPGLEVPARLAGLLAETIAPQPHA